jgi:hypothetical protein
LVLLLIFEDVLMSCLSATHTHYAFSKQSRAAIQPSLSCIVDSPPTGHEASGFCSSRFDPRSKKKETAWLLLSVRASIAGSRFHPKQSDAQPVIAG